MSPKPVELGPGDPVPVVAARVAALVAERAGFTVTRALTLEGPGVTPPGGRPVERVVRFELARADPSLPGTALAVFELEGWPVRVLTTRTTVETFVPGESVRFLSEGGDPLRDLGLRNLADEAEELRSGRALEVASNAEVAELTRLIRALAPDSLEVLRDVFSERYEPLPVLSASPSLAALGDARLARAALGALRDVEAGAPLKWALRHALGGDESSP